jgi:DNA-binding NarL/FixJ family response regulator
MRNALETPKVLSPRQQAIVLLVAEGLTVKQIARRLQMAYWTVKNQLRRVCEKLGTSRAALITRYAIRQGWVVP